MATYPDTFIEFRAFESLPGLDTVTLPPGLGSASFTLFAELGVDQARILTSVVPEPGAWLLVAIVGVAAGAAHYLRRMCGSGLCDC